LKKSDFIKQTYRKFMGNIKEKKVGVAGLQPNTFLNDYSKLSN